LEQGILASDERLIDLAVRRILMLHSIILSIGGIPLIYLGDEAGTLNDYSYVGDPVKSDDSRWVHRPQIDWKRRDPASPGGYIFAELARRIHLRKEQPAIRNGEMEVIDSGNPHLFGYVRHHGGQRLLIVANFSEHPQEIDANRLRVYGMAYQVADLITEQAYATERALRLEPYQCVWLESRI
jgi:amylosucrase